MGFSHKTRGFMSKKKGTPSEATTYVEPPGPVITWDMVGRFIGEEPELRHFANAAIADLDVIPNATTVEPSLS